MPNAHIWLSHPAAPSARPLKRADDAAESESGTGCARSAPGRAGEDVVNASTNPPASLYRQQAMESIESRERLDELLPVTSLRAWLLAAAAAVLVLGLLVYAAVTPRDVTVYGEGRVVGKQGVTLVTATVAGQFGRTYVPPMTEVRIGQVVAEVITGDRAVKQRAQRNGILLGYLFRPGDPVQVGSWLAEISNRIDDGRTALMMVAPQEAGKVEAGMPVKVVVPGGPQVTGVIGKDRSDVFAADRVQEGLGMLEPPAGPQVILVVKLDAVAPRGYEIEATILVSERTLLQQLLGMT